MARKKLNEAEVTRALMSFCSWNSSEKYRNHFEAGIYVCPKCGHQLFSAKAKYKHHTPWPAFTETIRDDSVSKDIETEPQESSKNTALKVRCGKCGNGLGHEFLRDGPGGKTSRF